MNQEVEFIVCSDLYLTPSAKYADILLPETSFLEALEYWRHMELWRLYYSVRKSDRARV